MRNLAGKRSIETFHETPDPNYPEALSKRCGFLLNQLAAFIRKQSEEALSEIGLKPRVFGALVTIGTQGPLRQAELGSSMCIDRTTTMEAVDELEARRLASRVTDPRNLKANALVVTSRGRDLIHRGTTLLEEVERTFVACLTERENSALQKALVKLLRAQRAAMLAEPTEVNE